jgi:Ca2+-binding EF-hand superfamily protein
MFKKKTKVAPLSAPEDLDLDAAEQKEKEQAARVKTAANYMNEKQMKETMAPFELPSGRLMFRCCLPRYLRETMLLNIAGGHTLSGTPAAAIRLIKLKPHELRRIRKAFHKMDNQHYNFISIAEFIHFLKCKDTTFLRKILQHCISTGADIDASGKLELGEFFLAVTVLCTFTRDQLLHATFVAFDVDKSGYLDREEMAALATAVQSVSGAANFASSNMSELVDLLDKDGDGVVSEQEFYQLGDLFPAVFHPVFRLQDRLRKATLGVTRWRRLVEAFDRQERSRAATLKGYEGGDPISFADYLVKMGSWKRVKQRAVREKKAAEALALKKAAASAGLLVKGSTSALSRARALDANANGPMKLPPLKNK